MLLDFLDLRSTLPLDRGYSGATSLLDALQRIRLCGYDFLRTRIDRIRSSLSLLRIVLSRILRTLNSAIRLNSPILGLIRIVLRRIVLAIDKTIHLDSPILSQLHGFLSILYAFIDGPYSLVLRASNGTYSGTSSTTDGRLSLFYGGINLSLTSFNNTADITSGTINALLDLFLKSTKSVLSLLSSLLSSLYSFSHIGLRLRPGILNILIGLLELIRNGLCSVKNTLSILESLFSLLCGLLSTLGILQVLTIGNHVIRISSPTRIGDLIAVHVNITEHVSKTRTFTVFLSKPEQLFEVLIHSLVGKLSLAVEDILHLIGGRNSTNKNFRTTCYGGRDTNLLSIPYPSIRSSLLSFGSNLNIVYKNM